MQLTCLIIDDEEMAIKVIENHLLDFPDIKVAGTFQNPLAALSLIETETIDRMSSSPQPIGSLP